MSKTSTNEIFFSRFYKQDLSVHNSMILVGWELLVFVLYPKAKETLIDFLNVGTAVLELLPCSQEVLDSNLRAWFAC